MIRESLQYLAKNYAVLVCVLFSALLMVTAASVYPGGSWQDNQSEGFVWSKNFISNLFAARALNGAENPARTWALVGMAFHAVGYGIFFIHMSQKVSAGHAATVLKIIGVVTILFDGLIATPWHDAMVALSSTWFLLGLFYITILLLRTKRHALKGACIAGLLTFYYTLYVYGSGNWALLAVLQKVSLLGSMCLVVGLEHFTTRKDFHQIAPDGQKNLL